MKTLDGMSIDDMRENIPDIEIVGAGSFKLICKVSSETEGWMRTVKAMEVPGGCIVVVHTQQRNVDGTYALVESMTFVPNAIVVKGVNGGVKLSATDEESW